MGRSRVSCSAQPRSASLAGSWTRSGAKGRGFAYAEPVDDVRVGGVSGATGKLLVAGGADEDRALHGSLAAGIQRAHVKDVDALHLAEDFQALQTGGLLEIGGHGARDGARAEKVVLGPDLCTMSCLRQSAAISLPARPPMGGGGSGHGYDAPLSVLYAPTLFWAVPARAAACSLGVVGPALAASPGRLD